MAKITFNTKCMGVKTPLTVNFDLTGLTAEELTVYALRSIIIDFQAGVRDTTASEVIAEYDGKTIAVSAAGKRKPKAKSLATIAFAKHQKGEALTAEETAALIAALSAVAKPAGPEPIAADDDAFTFDGSMAADGEDAE